MDDTIAAISTPLGQGAVAIIRVSGAQALALADRICRCAAGRAAEFASHTIHLGRIGSNGTTVDQVLLTVMCAPRTFTGEDTIEINCHGGPVVARRVLLLCLANGARLAEPGEFTKRAFLNGRMDLTQAEAVMDLITAKTEKAQSTAARALEGQLSNRVNQIRDRLLGVLAHFEAHIDFPDDDLAPDTQQQLRGQLEAITGEIQRLLNTATHGRILRHGVSIAIVGRPNVGKSSLLNALLGQDRAIVSPIPGTTRDIIEEVASIHGIPVRLSDTAGIRKTTGSVEAFGVDRSRKALTDSDLILVVLDGSRRFSVQDRDILDASPTDRSLVVVNKTDLSVQRLQLPSDLAGRIRIDVSALTNNNIDKLQSCIADFVWRDCGTGGDSDVAVNERHTRLLSDSLIALMSALSEISKPSPPEIVAQQLRVATHAIGEIVGKTTTEDLLDKIFSTFCIGK